MIKANYSKYDLQFKVPAGTSRGILNNKPIWILQLEKDGKIGLGEVSYIAGLSGETEEEIISALNEICDNPLISTEQLDRYSKVPSVRFAIEQALLDLERNGSKILFLNDFSTGKKGIPINGLVWMGDKNHMRQQVKDKIKSGYTCVKLKIGALDFEEEIALLKEVRKEYHSNDIEIRVDANGAFSKQDALEKLNRLSEFHLHSIEQPIRVGQWNEMAELCLKSPLPIALDEELIGVHDLETREKLITTIKPQYLIIKPSLVGGFFSSQDWINLAQNNSVGWWITSALESNIGLNAIAQWTAELPIQMPQGLGTGSLYTNNFESPLEIIEGKLYYQTEKNWDIKL